MALNATSDNSLSSGPTGNDVPNDGTGMLNTFLLAHFANAFQVLSSSTLGYLLSQMLSDIDTAKLSRG